MFVSTVPDRPFADRLSNGGTNKQKQEYREGTEEGIGRGPSQIFSADASRPEDGQAIYRQDGDRQLRVGGDNSLFAKWFGVGRGGEVTYGEVSREEGNTINTVIEKVAVPDPPGALL
ncbi:MAG: hypothetical protein ACPL4K_02565 [Candidatus Margulisiibacteriota bacterium]